MTTRGVRYVEVVDGHLIRHAVDAVGNDLTAELRWCQTHVEPVWVYNDGSVSCWYDSTVGWSPDEHVVVDLPVEG